MRDGLPAESNFYSSCFDGLNSMVFLMFAILVLECKNFSRANYKEVKDHIVL